MAKRIRASVIGAGWYAAQSHIPSLSACRDVVLDGVSRLGADELRRVRDHFGFAFASEDFRDVLRRRPDAVVVASPHHLHFEHAMAALEAGAHVLCEKPMTLSPAEAWALVAKARRADRALLVANGYHYLPGIAELRGFLQEGAVGRIEHATCCFVSATRAVFAGSVGMESWDQAFFRPDRATWQDPRQGGGFAYGQMSHAIALLLWLTGLGPRSVAARALEASGIDICDAAVVECEGGTVVALGGAPAMPEGRRALLRLVVSGSEGMLDLEVDRDRCEWWRHDGKGQSFEVAPGQWVYHCRGPVEALVGLARREAENLSPGEIGAQTTATIAAMVQSARQGGRAVPVCGPEAAQ